MGQAASNDKINVLFIIKPLIWSGADRVLLDVAARLNPDRYRVIYGLISNVTQEEIALPQEVPIVRFPMRQLNGIIWFKFFFMLCWALYKHQIQIIHLNSYHPGNFGRLAAYLMRVPIIIDHWHGFIRFNRKRRLMCRLLGRCTDLSFAISGLVRDYVVKECGLDPGKFKVLYNCLDYHRYQKARPSSQVRRELGLAPDLPVVGLVARLDHWAKGHRELLQAMALLKESHPMQALIVGGGRREAEMRELADSLNLSQVVHFLGYREDIPDLLAAMDIFVLPSYGEGVSLAMLEAMAAGRPVIVSRVGGLPEIVQDGETGLLITPRDPEALAEGLARLLAQPAWARSLGERAQSYVKENFSFERLALDLNAGYDEVVQRKLGV
jgi:glycosyltransferase involved in cell wall biosynthesis